MCNENSLSKKNWRTDEESKDMSADGVVAKMEMNLKLWQEASVGRQTILISNMSICRKS